MNVCVNAHGASVYVRVIPDHNSRAPREVQGIIYVLRSMAYGKWVPLDIFFLSLFLFPNAQPRIYGPARKGVYTS